MGIIERTILCAIGVGLGACANDAAEGEPEAAQVAIAITQAPGGVQCLVVRVRSNTRTEEREIPVVPGSAITASLTGLPSGSVSLHAAAYDENCQALTAAAVPTWLSDPSEQPLMLVAGNATLWDLALRPNGVVNIATDWADDSANTTQPDVVRSITAGAVHSCAVSSNGLVRCWGSDTAGQLGDGANTMQAHPVTVPSVFDATALASGWEHNCAVLSSGLVACWGSNFYGESGSSATEAYGNPPASLHDISGVVALGAGANHSCALLQLGSVRCWGGNGWGQLGMDKSGSSTPVAVSDVSTAIAIATGAFHNCVLLSSGLVQCWGSNENGQLGDGTTTTRSRPATVSGISTAIAVASGWSHSCAVLRDASVWCWGGNDYGQLGDGTTTSSRLPTRVSGISSAVAVTAGERHTCARLEDGTLRCWGENEYCQLGDGTTTSSALPVVVYGVTNAVGVAAGAIHTCVLSSTGSVQCWGHNGNLQLGNDTMTQSSVPVTVQGY